MKFLLEYIGSIGLCLDIIGALMMYFGTPRIQSVLYVYTREENKKFKEQDLKKNRILKAGIIIIVIGFLMQFLGSIISK